MQIIVNLTEHQYNNIITLESAVLGRIPYKGIVAGMLKAIKTGAVLPENIMILDKDKLEKDCEYDGYYDEFCAYSDTALEAAEIGEENHDNEL